MWLIERGTFGTGGGRIALPAIVRTALVRWYSGAGQRADEEAGIALVQQARIGGKWIACDCLAADEAPPIMTPAYLSEAETYYLRRLTGANRPTHQLDCPFFCDQATNRLTEVRAPNVSADPPAGLFEVLKPAPAKLARSPDEDESDDRTRQAAVPRLARLLWRLLSIAGSNRISALSLRRELSIAQAFGALRSAAARIDIAPGIALGRLLWTHPGAYHEGRAFAALRAMSPRWPNGHAPQGFLLLFSNAVRGHTIHLPRSEPIPVANRIQSPSTWDNPIPGPYLVIAVLGQYPEMRGLAVLRAYAQPIYSGHYFIPADDALDRSVIRRLLALQKEVLRHGTELIIEKPIFDELTPLGSFRPSFLVEVRCNSTSTSRLLAIETIDRQEGDYLVARRSAIALTGQLLPVITVRSGHVDRDLTGQRLIKALESGFAPSNDGK